MDFQLISRHQPAGDQPQAIDKLVAGIGNGAKNQTLLGVTGSGKTFTVANVIARIKKPTLVIAHNKTLAAQLCNEFREFFPNNSVHYFVSYYDYYQPEAYIPSSDTYIGKESMVNDEIDRLRHAATAALLTRRDVIIVASVSCIYGLGEPEIYRSCIINIKPGDVIDRRAFMRKLVDLQYVRTNADLKRGSFRVRGDNWEIMPPGEEVIYMLEVKNGIAETIYEVDPVEGLVQSPVEGFRPSKTSVLPEIYIAPAKHFITPTPNRKRAISAIQRELKERVKVFESEKKFLEIERLERRTKFDMAMIREVGYCHGVENYSRHLSGRMPGEPPATLLDYFPYTAEGKPDFLTVIDESHVTVPQIDGMYGGDRSRKNSLIEYGFRLPSAADNRPLKFSEFEKKIAYVIYTSATPSQYERKKSEAASASSKVSKSSKGIVEQIIRPTGLVDPKITIRPVRGQIEDLINRIEDRVSKKERVLVTTLTKKMAEDLSGYLNERKIKVNYLHSEVKTLDRIKILTNLRRGEFDVLVGVNLLREGLDLPEVSLVAILDADKEGFLRSETSLIQTIGRAARNEKGEVLIYADHITGSIRRAVGETERRRNIQIAYNQKYGIIPKTIIKEIKDILPIEKVLELETRPLPKTGKALKELIAEKEKEMKEAAKYLDFELAAILRDEIKVLNLELINLGKAKTKASK